MIASSLSKLLGSGACLHLHSIGSTDAAVFNDNLGHVLRMTEALMNILLLPPSESQATVPSLSSHSPSMQRL